MTTQSEILSKEFEALKADLIAKYDELGMRASGNWADSLGVSVEDKGTGYVAKIVGEKYSEQLEYGRQAGKQPPSAAIEKWLIDKGIAARVEREIKVSSLAFLIARKIAREGWKREGYGGVDLISQVVTPDRIQSIIDKVSDVYVPEFVSQFVEQLKQVA